MPGPINRTRPWVTEGWWLGLTMCVTLTSRIFSQQPGRWCVRFAHRPRLARIAHIRKGTEADGIPAVLAHHCAVAAMLALSVEGFFAYALHRVGTRPFGRGRTAMLIRDVLNEKGRRVISIGPEASVKQALALFVEHNIGSLPVVEASGQVIGIISERDVLRVPGTPYLTPKKSATPVEPVV